MKREEIEKERGKERGKEEGKDGKVGTENYMKLNRIEKGGEREKEKEWGQDIKGIEKVEEDKEEEERKSDYCSPGATSCLSNFAKEHSSQPHNNKKVREI